MTDADLARTVDAAWEARDGVSPSTRGAYRDAVEAVLEGLDAGELRVAEKTAQGWHVHQWLKKAVLLSFRLNDMVEIPGGPTDPDRGASRYAPLVDGETRSRASQAASTVRARSASVMAGSKGCWRGMRAKDAGERRAP